MLNRLLLVCSAALAACGGVTTSPLLDGGGGNDATTKDGGGGPPDATPGPEAGPDCTKLLADLQTKQQAAIQCCLTCGSLQCTQQIEGLCCPLTVTSNDSLASKDYLAALKAVKDANCQVNCPALACSQKPTDICGTNGTCNQ